MHKLLMKLNLTEEKSTFLLDLDFFIYINLANVYAV